MPSFARKTLLGVLVAAFVYAGIAIWTDAQAVAEGLTRLPTSVFTAALALSLTNYAVRFVKWNLMLTRLGVRVGLAMNITTFLAGMSMSITPGKVGEVLKSLLLRDAVGVPVARTAPIVFVERLTDLFGLVLIAAVGALSFEFGRVPLALTALALAAVVVVLQQPRWVHRILDAIPSHPKLEGVRHKLGETYEATQTLLAWPNLGATTAMSVVSWGMEALAFHWIVEACAGHTTLLTSSFVYAMTTILGAVSFLPGGLGVTEGSMIGVLKVLGVFDSTQAAVVATYVIRLTTLWFGVVLGFLALGVYRFLSSNKRGLTDGSRIH